MSPERSRYETWRENQNLYSDPNRPSLKELERLVADFSDIPMEAIIKEDLLRAGISFSDDALKVASGYKPKAYFIFSFDLTPIQDMKRREDLHTPEEIRLSAGPYDLRSTIVSVRNNNNSPYLIDLRDGEIGLFLEGNWLAKIEFPVKPSYYYHILSNGKPLSEVTPTIEWGYLIYLTIFRLCQYWGKDEECLFCDINENYRQQKNAGRPYQSIKQMDEMIEGLAFLAREESAARAYTITGGSITSHLQGKNEAAFYLPYAQTIEERFSGKWIGKIVLQALPKEELIPFKDAGIQIYHPNYEVWDARLFSLLCPGKERYVGREEWHQRILAATDIFGASHVIPNFVAGIEMAAPYGFETAREAVDSTKAGLDFFMSHGVVPRYTVWCPEPLTQLGAKNYGAPLEYHVRLMQAWRDTFMKYKLPVPPGYGEPGAGKAVFSVSAFMDVIEI